MPANRILVGFELTDPAVSTRLLFMLVQIAMAVWGAALFAFKSVLILKLSGFLSIGAMRALLVIATPILLCGCGCYGYFTLASRRRIHVVLYVLLLAALLNLQILLAVQNSGMRNDAAAWISRQWSALSDAQRSAVQTRLECCGLETATDRAGHLCGGGGPCIGKLLGIVGTVVATLQRMLVFQIFIESVSLCLLACLRLGKL